MERLRDDLQAEISNLRGHYEQEKYKLNQANGDIEVIERDKRLVEEAVHERGQEIRELNIAKDTLTNQLQAT